MKFDEVAGGIVGFILGGLISTAKTHIFLTKILPKLIPEDMINEIISECEEICKEAPESMKEACKLACIIGELEKKIGWKIGLIDFLTDLVIIVPSIYQATKLSGFKKGFGYGLGIGDLILTLPFTYLLITTAPGRKELVSKMKMARKYRASLARSHVP